MEETRETGLEVGPQMNQLTTNVFGGETRVKKATSLDLSDEEQVDMLLNSMQDVDYKINECIDKRIEVVGAYVVEREVDTMNEDTGEVITRKKHVLMLFDTDNKSYVTGSNACYMSFVDIVAIKGMPTKEKPLALIPIKVDAKEKGHTYLKLKIAK
jgi:hypothetical protein